MAAAALDTAWREDGWSPATPLGDTVLRRAVHAMAAATAVPAAAMGARVLRADDFVAADLGRPAGYWNGATLLRPPRPDEWTGLLDRVEAFAGERRGAEAGVFDLWSPFPTPDLRRRGWELSGHVPLMWRPPGGSEPHRAAGLRVERVHDAAGVRAWAATAVEAFPLDARPDAVATAALLEEPRVHLFVGRAGGRPVGVSCTVVSHDVNAVVFVAVQPGARGHGYGAAISRVATTARPDLPAVLLASDDGRPVYERLGYVPLVRWPLWLRRE